LFRKGIALEQSVAILSINASCLRVVQGRAGREATDGGGLKACAGGCH